MATDNEESALRVSAGVINFIVSGDRESLVEIALASITAIAYMTDDTPGNVANLIKEAISGDIEDVWETHGKPGIDRALQALTAEPNPLEQI